MTDKNKFQNKIDFSLINNIVNNESKNIPPHFVHVLKKHGYKILEKEEDLNKRYYNKLVQPPSTLLNKYIYSDNSTTLILPYCGTNLLVKLTFSNFSDSDVNFFQDAYNKKNFPDISILNSNEYFGNNFGSYSSYINNLPILEFESLSKDWDITNSSSIIVLLKNIKYQFSNYNINKLQSLLKVYKAVEMKTTIKQKLETIYSLVEFIQSKQVQVNDSIFYLGFNRKKFESYETVITYSLEASIGPNRDQVDSRVLVHINIPMNGHETSIELRYELPFYMYNALDLENLKVSIDYTRSIEVYEKKIIQQIKEIKTREQVFKWILSMSSFLN